MDFVFHRAGGADRINRINRMLPSSRSGLFFQFRPRLPRVAKHCGQVETEKDNKNPENPVKNIGMHIQHQRPFNETADYQPPLPVLRHLTSQSSVVRLPNQTPLKANNSVSIKIVKSREIEQFLM